MYLEGIILEGLSRINLNRSIHGLYHLIAGKKSIQSVHDANLFQLESLYGIYPSITRETFLTKIMKMKENKLLKESGKADYVSITDLGKEVLSDVQALPVYRYFNGLVYSRKDVVFLERLYLLVQTYSNIQMNHYSFIPVIDNQEVTKWIKTFYRVHRHVDTPKRIYDELYKLMAGLAYEEADFFVDRFSGYKHYGMSMEQLAIKYALTKEDAILYLTAITHKLLKYLEYHSKEYPILSQLMDKPINHKFITNTANETYQLLKQQYSLQDIARRRHLKLNTIYDHIVEIALYDHKFPIETFVGKREEEEILAAIKSQNTLRLKVIKENCNPSISYFQIRLILARWKALSGEDIHD